MRVDSPAGTPAKRRGGRRQKPHPPGRRATARPPPEQETGFFSYTYHTKKSPQIQGKTSFLIKLESIYNMLGRKKINDTK